jgi:acetaldehyde dehydrogenase (acetylating)
VQVAEACGLTVPKSTRVLIAELQGVGRDFPLSIEKLCPVLSFYVVADWREGCERCKQILRYGGMGHTMSIHSQNEQVILEFGLKKPAFRIIVNSPTSHGSIGLTTGLDPAMTLGCGGYGGNITSDNISPRHLLNIKRLAYEITPAVTGTSAQAGRSSGTSSQARAPKEPRGIGAEALAGRIDQFLTSRGYSGPPALPAPPRLRSPSDTASSGEARRSAFGAEAAAPPALPAVMAEPPLTFVCEEDVRLALKAGRKLIVSERAIVTPLARELGEQHHVLTFR